MARCRSGTSASARRVVSRFLIGVRMLPTNNASGTASGKPSVLRSAGPGRNSCESTPFQITRERNSRKVYQVFFDECKYNTNPPDSLFTKESLDARWAQVGKSYIKKQEKQKAKDAKEAQNSGSDSDKDNDKN